MAIGQTSNLYHMPNNSCHNERKYITSIIIIIIITKLLYTKFVERIQRDSTIYNLQITKSFNFVASNRETKFVEEVFSP